MKLTWNKPSKNSKRSFRAISKYPNLPFDEESGPDDLSDRSHRSKEDVTPENQESTSKTLALNEDPPSDHQELARSFQSQGDKLAEEGKYGEALGKWETALTLMPENAVLHEQKAQVLLEIGDSWSALKAATRATELEPSWAEAWVTLGRAQLNFGEPDSAVESFDRALAIKPDCEGAQDDRKTAGLLIKKRKQLHLSGTSTSESRFVVGDGE